MFTRPVAITMTAALSPVLTEPLSRGMIPQAPVSRFLASLRQIPTTLHQRVSKLFQSAQNFFSRPVAAAGPLVASAAVMSGCTESEIIGAALFSAVIAAGISVFAYEHITSSRRAKKILEEETRFNEERARRIELITKHLSGQNILPDNEFLNLLANDIDNTSFLADCYNYDSQRCGVLEECGTQFGLIFSQGPAPERIKTLFTKVFEHPRSWNGKSHFFFDALAKAIPHDPAYVMDCLLNSAEKIKGGATSMPKEIFEKLKAQMAIILVNHDSKLNEEQKQRARAIVGA